MLSNFGKVLKIFRMDRGIMQKDMAADLDYSSSYLSSMESGKKDVPKDFFERMQSAYKLTDKDKKALNDALAQDIKEKEKNIDRKQEAIGELLTALNKKDVKTEQIKTLISFVSKEDN